MQEGCSGDPARRAGNEYLFQMLAETNMSTFQELGVKRIVASCPHCFHTLGKEYGDFGGEDLEVFHHSEIIAKLQQEGKLPEAEKLLQSCLKINPTYSQAHRDPQRGGRRGGRHTINRKLPQIEETQFESANIIIWKASRGRKTNTYIVPVSHRYIDNLWLCLNSWLCFVIALLCVAFFLVFGA